MRVIFMGTAPFAEPTLRGLFASSHDVLAVVTQPDRPRGRGRKPAPSLIKTLAMASDCAVLQPASLRRDAGLVEQLASLRPEAIVVVAYGNILPPSVLGIPFHGCHQRPRFLAAEIPRGGTDQLGADAGGSGDRLHSDPDGRARGYGRHLVAWRSCGIAPDDDALSLGARLAELGAAGLLEVLAGIERGAGGPRPQSEAGVSYAPKADQGSGVRSIGSNRPRWLHNRVRGLVPWPGATARFGDLDVKLWHTAAPHDQSACGGAGHGDRGDAGGIAGRLWHRSTASSTSYSQPAGAACRHPILHRATAFNRGNGLPET